MDTHMTTVLVNSQIVAYSKVAMLMLLTYDYLLSLAQEVAYVWYSKWGIVDVLYLFSRYSPFIDTILAVEERLNSGNSIASCNRTTTFNTIFAGCGVGISDLILILRTFVMYQNSRKVLAILVLSWVIIGVINVVYTLRWAKSFSNASSLLSETPQGLSPCFIVEENKTGLVTYISLLVAETVVVALTILQELKNYSKCKLFTNDESITTTFYRDGILFYIFILPMTLGNVLVLSFAPPELQILETPLRVMHSILCCRLVVHVRQVAQAVHKVEDSLEDMSFRSNGSDNDTNRRISV
ncbi:hypothetical protein C8R41DRAFT_859015 [Lentinula lateritia]|uniref:DUF6533 domain-containing protein n=1 Tax=Lentinula lateritia TaxID=40482 RepID=A0ABQ8UXK7_9AGAR|nr:hypothetical protein C8R41DRAFT_859015 [Lentinula lateritia]